ncbi:MAG: protease complex subunit PrcB family protein [Lachnospiraceae bacterium]|nr:protease complex subunit PrcB family protein [Lachnospiraceae bacterium]
MGKKQGLLSVFLLALLLLCGCGLTTAGTEKIRDLDYTVLAESEIPETLLEEIESRKADDLKLTWREGGDLYVVRGFGMQETGGYSIQMREFYLADNAIYFKAELIGPENGEDVEKAVSYPYIVIKTERLEENVIFE